MGSTELGQGFSNSQGSTPLKFCKAPGKAGVFRLPGDCDGQSELRSLISRAASDLTWCGSTLYRALLRTLESYKIDQKLGQGKSWAMERTTLLPPRGEMRNSCLLGAAQSPAGARCGQKSSSHYIPEWDVCTDKEQGE